MSNPTQNYEMPEVPSQEVLDAAMRRGRMLRSKACHDGVSGIFAFFAGLVGRAKHAVAHAPAANGGAHAH